MMISQATKLEMMEKTNKVNENIINSDIPVLVVQGEKDEIYIDAQRKIWYYYRQS